jgi:hypothetical protein
MSKVFYFFAWVTIISALSLMGLIFFWLFYPYKNLDFQTEPHEIITKQVPPGGHVSFELDYCKLLDLPSEVTITFVDGFLYNTTPIPSNLEQGCHSVKMSVYVPRAIPLGDYSISMLYRTKLNPIRSVDTITKTAKFTVIK